MAEGMLRVLAKARAAAVLYFEIIFDVPPIQKDGVSLTHSIYNRTAVPGASKTRGSIVHLRLYIPVAICVILGAAGQYWYGSYLPIPPDVIYVMQRIGGAYLAFCIVVMVLADRERAQRLPRRIRITIRSIEPYSIPTLVIGVANLISLAFFENFPFGVVLGLALFPIVWMAKAVLYMIFSPD